MAEGAAQLRELSKKEFAYLLAVDRAREAELLAIDNPNVTRVKEEEQGGRKNVTSEFTIPRNSRRASTMWDRRDPYGRTPLWWACAQNHVIVAKALLDRGGTANSVDKVSLS